MDIIEPVVNKFISAYKSLNGIKKTVLFFSVLKQNRKHSLSIKEDIMISILIHFMSVITSFRTLNKIPKNILI